VTNVPAGAVTGWAFVDSGVAPSRGEAVDEHVVGLNLDDSPQ
jgi:hypothetical protein